MMIPTLSLIGKPNPIREHFVMGTTEIHEQIVNIRAS